MSESGGVRVRVREREVPGRGRGREAFNHTFRECLALRRAGSGKETDRQIDGPLKDKLKD